MASEDSHTFPGATCQPQNSADAVFRNNEGDMLNRSGINRTWICPILRDVTTGDEVEFAAITVIGSSARCTFRSMTFEGRQVDIETPNNIDQRANNLFRLQYAPNNQNIASAVDGYYHFVCNIPADSGVVTYTVTENSGEGWVVGQFEK